MLNFYKLKISLRDLSVGGAVYPPYILNLMLMFSSYTYGTIIVRTKIIFQFSELHVAMTFSTERDFFPSKYITLTYGNF